jgi:hypothetical protein
MVVHPALPIRFLQYEEGLKGFACMAHFLRPYITEDSLQYVTINSLEQRPDRQHPQASKVTSSNRSECACVMVHLMYWGHVSQLAFRGPLSVHI